MKWTLLIALLTSACLDVVEHGTPVALTVVTTDCEGVSVIDGATQLVLTVNQETRVLFTRTVPVTAIPQRIGLPDATGAQLQVTAVDGAGRVIARGSSLHFEVGPAAAGVSVELSPVDRFVRVCTSLGQARAFHTATQLRDGRVLFVGGLSRSGEPMSSMEVLGAGMISDAGPLEITARGNHFPLPRAHHAAVLTDSGQVFISGGENLVPLASSVVVDPEMEFASGALRAGARSRHGAFKVGSAIFLLGGTSLEGGQLVPDPLIERLDFSTIQMTTVATLPAPRMEAAFTLFGMAAIFAGGAEGAGASTEVRRVSVDAPFIHPLVQLHTARRSATAIGLGPRVLVIGGFGSDGVPLASTEWLELGGETFPAGPSIAARARACAVPLPGFRALVVGGVDANGPSAAAEVIDSTGTGQPVTFPGVAREGHACTVLDDGSVLVSGGLDAAGQPLGDLWRYTPSER